MAKPVGVQSSMFFSKISEGVSVSKKSRHKNSLAGGGTAKRIQILPVDGQRPEMGL
jgi:hypothetical protein